MTAPRLLMHMSGANGSTYFPDSSPNGLAIASAGGTAISYTKSRFGTGSASFNGSTKWLTIPQTNLSPGAGDFTIDFWCNTTALPPTNPGVIYSSGTAGGIDVSIAPSSGYVQVIKSGVGVIATSSAGISLATWQHIAVTRAAGTLRIFIDGAQYYSASDSTTYTSTNNACVGSEDGSSAVAYNGYVDELRVIIGQAVWAGSFTPLNRPYTATDLLLHFDEANGATTMRDSGDNSLTLTANGAVAISTTQSKFGGASLYVPGGTSDYLKAGTSANFDFGTGPFTVSAWVYIAANSALDGDGTRTAAIASSMTASNFFGWNLYILGDASTTGTGILINGRDGTTGFNLDYHYAACTVSHGAFHFITVCFDGVDIHIALDGVQQTVITGTGGSGYSQFNTFGNELTIGGSKKTGYENNLNGYIDELSITKGAALYPSTFTPPTLATEMFDPALLLHFDGANASTTIVDSSLNIMACTANGAAALSTAQSKFGTASLSLNGSSTSYVSVANSPLFDFETGDFTMSAWVYTAPAQILLTIISSTSTMSGNGYVFYVKADGVNTLTGIGFAIRNGANSTAYESPVTFATGSFRHYEVTRSGGVVRLFIDGISQTVTTSTTGSGATSAISSGNPMTVGIQNITGNYYPHDGYIDEFYVEKGVALHTASFTPPVSPYFNTFALLPTLHGVGAVIIGEIASATGGTYEPYSFIADLTPGLTIYAATGYNANFTGDLTDGLRLTATAYENNNGSTIDLEALTIDSQTGWQANLSIEALGIEIGAFYPIIGTFDKDLQPLALDATATFGFSASASLALELFTLSSQVGAQAYLELEELIAASGATITSPWSANISIESLRISSDYTTDTGIHANLTLEPLFLSDAWRAQFDLPALTIRALGPAADAGVLDAYVFNLKHRQDEADAPAPVNQASNYPGFGARAVHRVGDEYYIVDDYAIHLFRGDTDNGVPIPWSTKSGYTDNKTSKLKVINHVNVGGRVTNGLTATIWAAEYGGVETSFPQTTPRTNAARNLRISCGRGIRARYFAIELSNINGDNSNIRNVELTVQTTGRDF